MDTQYSQFMIQLLQNLEPRFYHVQEYIFEEDEEVNEQIYVITKTYRNQKNKMASTALASATPATSTST